VRGRPFGAQGSVAGGLDAHGFSAGIVARSARFGGLLDYAFEHVQLTHGDSTYAPSYAPRHRLTGGVVVFPSASTSVRLGVTTAFGRRTTVSIGDIEWESCNFLDRGCEFTGSPELGDEARGGTALPDYVRVDLGLRKHWHVGLGDRDATISGFLTVTNLLSRTNVLTYTRSTTDSELTPVEMRPLAPLAFGIEIRY